MHPPRKRGGLGRGLLNVLVAFGELVLFIFLSPAVTLPRM
ncbi:hypothetical protein B6N60_01078 [Richelia sinica FACHB-800]|uniref:Uncharacterized protein n=1 Tax=Richelia sinica FACHB-800 TaxID=1357546 RepID=A0A975Y3R0_9NOST|nr:hypothetical protein B6N60_01078 [Richelia sinica FACHB-800]